MESLVRHAFRLPIPFKTFIMEANEKVHVAISQVIYINVHHDSYKSKITDSFYTEAKLIVCITGYFCIAKTSCVTGS